VSLALKYAGAEIAGLGPTSRCDRAGCNSPAAEPFRSGVAKTTIYRHWPTRADLLRDACSNVGTPMEVPDVGTYEADVTALLMDLSHLLRSAKWTSVLPSVIDAAERDEIARMYSKLQEGYSAPLRFVIQRAIQRGELAKTTDIDVVIAALTGPLFYRRWFSREPRL
jgi:AcrR family transcriptional regulator